MVEKLKDMNYKKIHYQKLCKKLKRDNKFNNERSAYHVQRSPPKTKKYTDETRDAQCFSSSKNKQFTT